MGWPSSLALGVVVMLLVIVSMHSGTLLLLTRHFDRMDRHVDAKLSLLHESMRQQHIAPVLASTNELNATLRLVEQRSSTMQRELAHARRSAAAVGEHVQALLSQKQKDAETLRNLTRDTRHLEHRLSVYGAMLQTYQEKSNAAVSTAALLAAKRTTANISLRTTSSDARSVDATAAFAGTPSTGTVDWQLSARGRAAEGCLDARGGEKAWLHLEPWEALQQCCRHASGLAKLRSPFNADWERSREKILGVRKEIARMGPAARFQPILSVA